MLYLGWSPQGNGGSWGHLVVISSLLSMRQAYSSNGRGGESIFSLSYVLSCNGNRSSSIQLKQESFLWCGAAWNLGMKVICLICLLLRCH